jgi:hypothetical protein
MHQSEAEELAPCRGCGAEIATVERAYVFGQEDMLCFECAVARGGTYDERLDRWEPTPDVSDLPPQAP